MEGHRRSEKGRDKMKKKIRTKTRACGDKTIC